jgi:hypothetical protein
LTVGDERARLRREAEAVALREKPQERPSVPTAAEQAAGWLG